jgi:hypothetical protein
MNFSFLKNSTLSLIIFFFLISSSLILSILPSIFNENFTFTAIYAAIYFYFFILIELLVIFLFLKSNFLKKSDWFIILIISLFLSYNFYTTILSNSSFFIFSIYKIKLAYCVAVFFISFLIIKLIFKKIRALNLLIVFYFFINIFYLMNNLFINFKENTYVNDQINNIKINSDVNIHIFSFEALIPNSIANLNLNIESVQYDKILKDNEFQILKNNFADNVATSESLNSLLFGNAENWRNLPNNIQHSFFAGRSLSPLMQILKNNKYKIYTGYFHQYMGQPGRYVDEYLTFRSIKINDKDLVELYPSFCQFKMPWYHFQIFGYCDFLKLFIINNNDENNFKDAKEFNNYFINKVMLEKSSPVFSLLHIYSPGHVTANLKGSEYKDYFKNKRDDVIIYFKKIISNLNKINDKKNIIIIIGDNGSLQTWDSLENDKSFINISNENKNFNKFKILDRYAVFGSFKTQNLSCEDEISTLKNNLFNTNNNLLNTLIQCITNDDLYFKKNYNLTLPEKLSYKEYVYE